VRATLAAKGLAEPLRQAPYLTYTTVWFVDVVGRQRLVLDEADGTLARAAVVVDGAGTGAGADVDDFERIRRTLVQRLGPPTRVWALDETTLTALGDGTTEVLDWQGEGSTIRFGRVRRLDGSWRTEVLKAPTLPPPDDGAWGLEDLR